ncbi:calcium-activated chloride channel regulator 1-like [Topomyia yanbarensis]|uniref:calcium-activated chloride channel regulator 1-like n=1 Tax=Topomyia yanbarensis TaxID=2498891 RepID=UPI00273B8A6B|nr:calcium-activated chloride channel regulator 1-like [Topomyia yanbarensis]
MTRIYAVPAVLLLLLLASSFTSASHSSSVYVDKSAYKNVVVEIRDNVPVENCQTILHNLEIMLTSASQYLFSAMDGRVYFGDISVILPARWPNSCIPYNQTRTSASGERSDVTIRSHTRSDSLIWTDQFSGCGEPGDQIYIDSDIIGRDTIGREFVREWAKYRYGVFDEIGYDKDPIYPRCYINDDHEVKLTGCSDAPVSDHGLCGSSTSSPVPYNISDILDRNARTSIMFAAEAPSVTMFCDEGTHNRYAPSKHNQMCDRRSTLDVILKHPDFAGEAQVAVNPSVIVNTTPKFSYKTRKSTRYVIIIDETLDMQLRESWSFLRSAIRKWVVYDLPSNTEIGMVLANDTATEKILQISSLHIQENKDLVASFIPYSPSDSRQPACLTCAISDAISMLNERTRLHGPASSVILVVAPGMDFSIDHKSLANAARASKIRITTINYPNVIRRQPLDTLAHGTGGSAFSVFECKYNGERTYLTTYFELTNVLFNIGKLYYEGNTNDLPTEIYRKELIDVIDDSNQISKRTSRTVTGSFMLDSFMGPPAQFFVYIHNPENPLITNLKLTSPNGNVYTSRSDSRSLVKQLMISAVLNETGTWTYTIDRFNGNPQPHYVQVIATPRSRYAPVIQARAWIHQSRSGGPPIVYAEVRKGDLPVSSALVEVVVTRPDKVCQAGSGMVNECREKFKLLDTGAGDPDITKGDGVYSRYFNAEEFGGAGAYQFEVTVSDNGNTAYALSESGSYGVLSAKQQPARCCGSSIAIPLKQPLTPFQRTLQPMTLFVTQEQLNEESHRLVGRISDLSADIEAMRVRLSWTSPDMGGKTVARYEVKYATTIKDIVDNFDTAAVLWHHDNPLTYSIGDDSTFTLNITHEPHLIGQILYFAIRPFSKLTKDAEPGPISNYVRVFVSKPKPTTLFPPSSSGGTESYDSIWSSYDGISKNDDGMDIIPRIAKTMDLGLELLLPIIAGIILLLALILIYCYFCIVKKRHDTNDDEQKKPIKCFKSDHRLSNSHSVIVTAAGNASSPSSNTTTSSSSSPNHVNQQSHLPTSVSYDMNLNDHQTVGIPTIYNIDDDMMITKKRYSTMGPTHPMEQQLIEELKQQQHIIDSQSFIVPTNNNCAVSIISSASNNTTLTRSYNPNPMLPNGRTLSPYESWSATQLLQEHEHHHPHHPPTLMDDLVDNNGPHHFYGTQPHSQHDQMSLLNNNHLHESTPPVPPLPNYTTTNNGNSGPVYVYGQQQPANHSNNGSVNSVNSGSGQTGATDTKKRRNVTMV